ncbi:MAG: Uncharacterized protein G01um101472_4 [Parcubacteria group bacterium Gr01-1014_72]|nr:MAG: Uncharacterized protein G01um101472_4 [Parcubacteria group bacterium Gr01-1014_72]
MRFQVPQFIEIEDQIFGRLTVKQFLYVVGAAGLSFVLYKFIPWWFVSIPLIVPVAGLGLALAFYKFNGKPFVFTLEAAFHYITGNRLYIWKKRERKPHERAESANTPAAWDTSYVPKLSDSKLKDLTWSLDIKEHMGLGAEETMRGK